MNRLRAELRAAAQSVWEVFHAFDAVSVAGPPWRWRVIDTGSRERVADVHGGRRRIGADEPPRTWVDDAIDNLRAVRAGTRRIGR